MRRTRGLPTSQLRDEKPKHATPARASRPTKPHSARRRWGLLLAGLGLALCTAFAAFLIGLVRSYEQVQNERAPVISPRDLAEVFAEHAARVDERVSTTPLSDPVEAWVARWRLLHDAERNIDVAYFILDGDLFGLSFLGALLAAAERGVKVRVLVDGVATDMADTTHTLTGKNFLDALASHPNVQVRTYRPLLTRVSGFVQNLRLSSLIASEHDKMINVDGVSTLTGGRNIAQAYFTPIDDPEPQFIDTDILLGSPGVVGQMRAAFERVYTLAEEANALGTGADRRAVLERARSHMDAWLRGLTPPPSHAPQLEAMERDWQEQLRRRPELRGALLAAQPSTPFAARVGVLDSRARLEADAGEITEAVLHLAASARQEIVLLNPYFVLGESLTSVLSDAAARGVRILVLTNSPLSSDNAGSQALFLEQWPTLLARVPTMRLYVLGGRDTMHSKVMLFDDSLSLVGTYNLDPTAMRMSSELMVGVWSKPLNAYFRRQFERHTSAPSALTHEYTIRTTSSGDAVFDENGQPRVLFGPEDHLSEAQLEDVRDHQKLLHAIRRTLALEPFIRPASGARNERARAPD